MSDLLIIGSGLFGCTVARILAEQGKSVLLVDKRNHIGGNCYTKKIAGINTHVYGPHLFHCNDIDIWKFVNRFSKFNNYQNKPKVKYKNKIYSFPINLMTLYQIYGTTTPNEAKQKLEQIRIKNTNPKNLEEHILNEIGYELYEIFIKGYTTKQWNKNPKELPTFIIKRLPIRLTYDDRYFNDKYQGIPTDGYTLLFENMLDHKNIKFELNVDFFNNKNELLNSSKKIIYTGKIDEFYDYSLGQLEYRSLRFENKILQGDFQGNAIINHTEADVPYTRTVEHKHFEYKTCDQTVVTWEYPENYDNSKIPYYPINNQKNNILYENYSKLNKNENIIFGGRLGKYQYMDMHQIIASATNLASKINI